MSLADSVIGGGNCSSTSSSSSSSSSSSGGGWSATSWGSVPPLRRDSHPVPPTSSRSHSSAGHAASPLRNTDSDSNLMALGDAAVSSSIVAANPSSDCSRITVLEQQMAQLLSHLNQQVTLNTVLHEKLESALSQVAELSLQLRQVRSKRSHSASAALPASPEKPQAGEVVMNSPERQGGFGAEGVMTVLGGTGTQTGIGAARRRLDTEATSSQ